MRLVRYTVVGALTTGVNYLMMWLFFRVFGVWYDLSNALAIILSVVFAYFTNRTFVFRSRTKGKAMLREIAAFFASRTATMLLEWGSLFLIHTIIGVDAEKWGMITKLGINVVIIVLNFVLSQLFVFKRKK